MALSNFRNYTDLTLNVDMRPVVLTGPNGAGKTNLLEAVSLLSQGRGLRGVALSDLCCAHGSAGLWAVAAQVNGPAGDVSLGTGLNPREDEQARLSRAIRIDGQPAKSSGQLADYLHVSWLTPSMDGLFTGAASERRRFLDRLMGAFDPGYQKRINQFERAMRQRNRLLETNETDSLLFDGLEMQMAEVGVAIAAARLEAVNRLASVIQERRQQEPDSPFPWGELELEGMLENDLADYPAVDVEDRYLRVLRDKRARDRAAKRTLDGPHRSDFIVQHGPKQMLARLCSTGEQKVLLVGLILAHSQLVKQMHNGYAPILLLDEIAAHLDEARREALMENIVKLSIQAWMSGTDQSDFESFGRNAQFLTVNQGKILS